MNNTLRDAKPRRYFYCLLSIRQKTNLEMFSSHFTYLIELQFEYYLRTMITSSNNFPVYIMDMFAWIAYTLICLSHSNSWSIKIGEKIHMNRK